MLVCASVLLSAANLAGEGSAISSENLACSLFVLFLERSEESRICSCFLTVTKEVGAHVANDAKNLTPNPFPSGKGNQKV